MKRKVVKLTIGLCVDCPGMRRGFCTYVEPARDLSYAVSKEEVIENESYIPEWCPLEDAEEIE